jgi:hypothetical protein
MRIAGVRNAVTVRSVIIIEQRESSDDFKFIAGENAADGESIAIREDIAVRSVVIDE